MAVMKAAVSLLITVSRVVAPRPGSKGMAIMGG